MPALPLFTLANLILIALNHWNGLEVIDPLIGARGKDAGYFLLAVSALTTLLPRVGRGWRYDLFALATLPLWFAHWRQFFRLDAPVFSYYPVYFALLTMTVTLTILNRPHVFERETLEQMRFLQRLNFFQGPIIALFALASLAIPNHFLAYPALMSILVMRYALVTRLENALPAQGRNL